jgi:hypothetical protein
VLLVARTAVAAEAAGAEAAAGEAGPMHYEVPMQAHAGYSSERCLTLDERRLSVEFESPVPVEFNVHHHTDTATEFPVPKRVTTSYSGTVSISERGEYCFMWMNDAAHDAPFVLELILQAVAE